MATRAQKKNGLFGFVGRAAKGAARKAARRVAGGVKRRRAVRRVSREYARSVRHASKAAGIQARLRAAEKAAAAAYANGDEKKARAKQAEVDALKKRSRDEIPSVKKATASPEGDGWVVDVEFTDGSTETYVAPRTKSKTKSAIVAATLKYHKLRRGNKGKKKVIKAVKAVKKATKAKSTRSTGRKATKKARKRNLHPMSEAALIGALTSTGLGHLLTKLEGKKTQRKPSAKQASRRLREEAEKRRKLLMRRNPGEYERAVGIIERAIRKAVKRAKARGIVGMSERNLKAMLSSIDIREAHLPNINSFNRAFDDALARFNRKPTMRIYNPKKKGRRCNTPSTDRLYKEFQGRAPRGKVRSYLAPSNAPANHSELGPLVDIEFAPGGKYEKLVFNKRLSEISRAPTQGELRAALRNPPAILTQAQIGGHRRLYITLREPFKPNGMPAAKTQLLGEGLAVTYVTAKPHLDDGKLHMYRHAYGDRGGSRPHLYANKGGAIEHRGGEYTVVAEGIDG